jgi:hypothetical protein
MLLVSIAELMARLPLLPGEKLYMLYVVPMGFAMVAKATPEGRIIYRMGTYRFFGPHKEVMQYREFAGIRRNATVFEAFVSRYRTLAEESGLEWGVEDLWRFATVEAQLVHLRQQGYLDDERVVR